MNWKYIQHKKILDYIDYNFQLLTNLEFKQLFTLISIELGGGGVEVLTKFRFYQIIQIISRKKIHFVHTLFTPKV